LCRYFDVPIECLFLGEDSSKDFKDIELLTLFNKMDKLEKEDRDFVKNYLRKFISAKKELDIVKK